MNDWKNKIYLVNFLIFRRSHFFTSWERSWVYRLIQNGTSIYHPVQNIHNRVRGVKGTIERLAREPFHSTKVCLCECAPMLLVKKNEHGWDKQISF